MSYSGKKGTSKDDQKIRMKRGGETFNEIRSAFIREMAKVYLIMILTI